MIPSTERDGYLLLQKENNDAVITKISDSGLVIWKKTFGGSGDDELRRITYCDDGYICVGTTGSNDGTVSGNHGLKDLWVVKISRTGDLQWQKCLGGSDNDFGAGLKQTGDKGFIVIGSVNSGDGDVNGFFSCRTNAWVTKLDKDGDLIWSKCYANKYPIKGEAIEVIEGNKYVLAIDNPEFQGLPCAIDNGNISNPTSFYGGIFLVRTDSIGGIGSVEQRLTNSGDTASTSYFRSSTIGFSRSADAAIVFLLAGIKKIVPKRSRRRSFCYFSHYRCIFCSISATPKWI